MIIKKNNNVIKKKEIIDVFKNTLKEQVFSLDKLEIQIRNWKKVIEEVEFPIIDILIYDGATSYIKFENIDILFGNKMTLTMHDYSITYLNKLLKAIELASKKTINFIEEALNKKGGKNV